MRKGFTLIELMISIVILSILMLFLYKSYSSLNRSNKQYSEEVAKIVTLQKIKKTFYMDLSLSSVKSLKILNQSKTEDIVFFQSKNSIHDRQEPYIAYIFNNKKLYRLESLKEFKEYPLGMESEFDVDFIGKANNFRLYINDKNASVRKYLLDCDFTDMSDIILKIRALNI